MTAIVTVQASGRTVVVREFDVERGQVRRIENITYLAAGESRDFYAADPARRIEICTKGTGE